MPSASLLVALFALATLSLAQAASAVIVRRYPGCGYCKHWVPQVLAQFARRVPAIDAQRHTAFQRAQGVPVHLASCHTAIMDGMVSGDHVPIAE